jgi:hypothetical protein
MIGAPDSKNPAAFLDKVRGLEPDLDKFLALYNGKPNPLIAGEKTDVAEAGTAPWRTEQLYNGMVEAFKCYTCSDKTTRLQDLAAAIEYGGVMGHFIGDMGQPLHVTADYDGYSRGQGGIHGYFETFLLNFLDEKLTDDVVRGARNKATQQEMIKRLKLQAFDTMKIPQIVFHLAADSYSHQEAFYKADRKSALIREGSKLVFGAMKTAGALTAERRDYREPKVQAAFRPLIVERLIVSSFILYKLWYRAWVEAGEPDLHDANIISVAYPMDVPFILPPEPIIKDVKAKLEAEL